MLPQEIIKEVFKLNDVFNGKAQELFGFKYETNGYYECITFNEHVLWDDDSCQAWLSERPDFDEDAIQDDDHDEDIIGCVKRRFNDYINTLKTCRYDVPSKKSEKLSGFEATMEMFEDMKYRCGFRDVLNNIDKDIEEEMFQKWVNIIEKYN